MSNSRTLFYLQQTPALTIVGRRSPARYGSLLAWLIGAFTATRLLLAFFLELGNDEAYYWLYTQQLQWNYFDHPPMVALMGRVFTANLSLQGQELFVRLGSITSAAFSSWFLYKATSLLHSPRAGWIAAILYNTSFYAGIVAGLFIMPDSPQMFFWTLCLWLLARIICLNDRSWTSWMLFGLAAGCCIMSKVHGGFIWIGAGLYAFSQKPEWFGRPHLYVAAFLTLVVISPLLTWNIHNDFVTFRFHSSRVVVEGFGLNEKNFRNELFGQIFFNNPVNVALVALSLSVLRSALRPYLHRVSFLVFTGVPLIFTLLLVSLFRPVFPHWSGPAYVSLLPIAAMALTRVRPRRRANWIRLSLGSFIIFLVGWMLLVYAYPGTWGSRQPANYGRGDVTLDRYGWKAGGAAFKKYYEDGLATGAIKASTPLVCRKWWGAHVEYYFARPAGLAMIGLGEIQEVGTYLWLNPERRKKITLEQALCIIPSDEHVDPFEQFSDYYNHIELEKTIEIRRNGEKARHFSVYSLRGWKGRLPNNEHALTIH